MIELFCSFTEIKEMERYTINISFVTEERGFVKRTPNIVEHVKTKREAYSYKDIIDDTVSKALIKDNVTGKVEWLKR